MLKLQPGISFMVRTKDGGETLEESLSSLRQVQIPYDIIVVDNGSRDNTAQVLEKLRNEDKAIQIFSWPWKVAKPGVETYLTPEKSPHSIPRMYNYALSLCTREWVFKWDDDFVMTPSLASDLQVVSVCSDDYYRIPAKFEDTGEENVEMYLFRRGAFRSHEKCTWWERLEPHPVEDKVGYIPSPIIHKSSLSTRKPRQDEIPWWREEPGYGHLEEEYRKIIQFVGEGGKCARASDPATDAAFHKFLEYLKKEK